jgi:hypothetical protein
VYVNISVFGMQIWGGQMSHNCGMAAAGNGVTTDCLTAASLVLNCHISGPGPVPVQGQQTAGLRRYRQ